MEKDDQSRRAFAKIRARSIVTSFEKAQKLEVFEQSPDCFSQFVFIATQLIKLDSSMDDMAIRLIAEKLEYSRKVNCADEFTSFIQSDEDIDFRKEVKPFSNLDLQDRGEVYGALFNFVMADGYCDSHERRHLDEVAAGLDLTEAQVRFFEQGIINRKSRSQKLVRSGMGLLAAVVVMVIFVFTATFLKSVLFGIILADLFQPLQKFYLRQLSRSRILRLLQIFLGKMVQLNPLRKFRKSISEDKIHTRRQERRLNRSCYMAVLSAVFVLVALITGLAAVSVHYGTKVKEAVEEVAETPVKKKVLNIDSADVHEPLLRSDVEDGSVVPVIESTGPAADGYLDKFKVRFENYIDENFAALNQSPEFREVVDQIRNYMDIASNREGIYSTLASYGFAVLKKTGNVLGGTVDVLLNVMLSFFFFSFFLRQMASFNKDNKDHDSLGVYLVKSIFSSSWMPQTTLNTQQEAAEILDTVVSKLRIWLKGHCSIITIESTIYITAFSILGVPYAVPLGVLAGSAILVPYLGALTSSVLTVLVIYISGALSGSLIVEVLLVYILVNMILEQFFLYPYYVGEALGLNILETIIVVLLGGLWAGVLGVIFAAPVASVIKYLIPRIYKTFRRESSGQELTQ